MKTNHLVCLLAFIAASLNRPLAADTFAQNNLVSDLPGMAAVTDSNLKNPWGMSFSPTSPIWVSNQGSNTSTLYSGTGTPAALVVSVPPTSPPPTGPTGQVFNSTASDFVLANGTKATFLFDTLAGTVNGWNGGSGTTASVVLTTAGASYTGLALGNNGSANYLYAANFVSGGGITVLNSSFSTATLPGTFTDPNLPSGYEPYNIQNVNGKLYVEYAQINPATGRAVTGLGLGYVDVFDTNGNLLQRLVSGGQLDAPWGVAIAPSGFGSFGNDVLIGNFGNGEINVYDPTSGTYIGTLSNATGAPLVNSGLWGIAFGNSAANPNALYFAAGINNEADGLFGDIVAVPEPAGWGLIIAGFAILGGVRSATRRKRVSP